MPEVRPLGCPALVGRDDLLALADRRRPSARNGSGGLLFLEVVRHIARGETNAQIAVELGVSPRTVTAHVEHILAKLGAGRRAEIAAWVASRAGAEAPGDPPRADP
jgi:hypothetical protein